jgi:uncharacterized lipoprotein YbaY
VRQVGVRFRFRRGEALPRQVAALITLEEVTHADARATVLARRRVLIEPGAHDRILLDCPEPYPHMRYAVRARVVDPDGHGQPAVGDWATVQSYPVMTFGCGDEVELELVQVG